ncbi:hypothetical protein PINS_up011916 [Pythium insidiosum]|nr:hypothetical protein PINS_up011916 [Pythium insidiosum]
MKALMCVVIGDGSVFGVNIDDHERVWQLKDMIKEKEMYKCDADQLTLYVAKKGGNWLKADDSDVLQLKEGVVTTVISDMMKNAMDPSYRVRNTAFGFPDEDAAEDGEIHVLVELPKVHAKRQLVLPQDMPSNKRLRTEIVAIDVPQITIQGVQYVTLPAAFLEKCGFRAPSDLMLYCRRQVKELWSFLQDGVVAKNGRGFIVGPPGTGKSMSTLSYVASLDREEWNVVWIHLSNCLDTCLSLGTKEFRYINDLSSFELPRVAGKKLFICLDGFKATTRHNALFRRVFADLDKTNERLIVCSPMATLGKRNREDDHWANIKVFFMYSWTQDEYVAAIADQTFYGKIVSELDATNPNEVNDDDDSEAGWSEEDKKKHALSLKFYYAGGSCRFMFQYRTDEVIEILDLGVESAATKSDLVKYCRGQFHIDAINRLFGMHRDGIRNVRFPVSSYAASLFAKECDEDTIAQLAARLNASNNASVDGHLFEWLFLACVPKRAVKLFGDHGVEEILPQANVLRFDPKKRFKVLRDGQIKGDQSWLQPTAWNQGGYDAVYFDKDEGKVIFVQVTRSDKHDFKIRFFYDVLCKLKSARMEIKQVVVYFVVKPAQYLNFKIDHIEDRDVLLEFDASWTRPEESHVRVRAFEVGT